MKEWVIIGNYYRGSPFDYEKIGHYCKIIAALVNLQNERSPLRGSVKRFTEALRANRCGALWLLFACAALC
jgi:hypothetical protein